MKVLYFAWMRTRVGLAEEDIAELPDPATVAGLIERLKTRSPGHAHAFETPALVRVAVNQDHAGFDTPLAIDDEVAFFPPITGG